MGSFAQQPAVLSIDTEHLFQPRWPVNEVVLGAALNSGLSPEQIAREFGVSVADVLELCDEFDLELGQL
ncbi:MAG: hypothetical protein EP335_11720 [Alphaproteobacteria bacterium]|nr:MAG: hypothetical protein EP335_11720 [Alphaproteobacteria bacterium]